MAPGARGKASCAKASNPYHECTQACLQPNSNKTTPKSLANDKNNHYKTTRAGGYGPRVTDDNADGCPKASNGITPPALKNESKRQQKAAAVEEVEASGEEAALDLDTSRIIGIAVGGYNVKESYGGILRSILHKYGDIGATSKLESLVMRSYYIQCVCFVVNQLQQSSSSSSGVKLKELSALLKDVESAGVRVDWLRSVLLEAESLREDLHSHRTRASSPHPPSSPIFSS